MYIFHSFANCPSHIWQQRFSFPFRRPRVAQSAVASESCDFSASSTTNSLAPRPEEKCIIIMLSHTHLCRAIPQYLLSLSLITADVMHHVQPCSVHLIFPEHRIISASIFSPTPVFLCFLPFLLGPISPYLLVTLLLFIIRPFCLFCPWFS